MAAVVVYTARLAYQGEDRLDVTNWGNHPLGKAFAPSDALLIGFKRLKHRGLSSTRMRAEFDRYAREYRAEMEASRRWRAPAWREVLGRAEVTLCCYCENPSACHRTVLAGMFAELGAKYEGER